ncbi:MAG: fused MFS/spermidine synthase [Candidatus Freyarchaeum deiterrae]
MNNENLTLWFANWHTDNIQHLVKVKPIYSTQSEYQRIEVVDSEVYGRLLILNGEIQLSTKFNSYIHESMTHPALLLHPHPKNVLIIGGGDGGSTTEVVKHNVESDTVVEIDRKVVQVAKEYFPGVSAGFSDKRVTIKYLDGRDFVEKSKDKFDVIINDISDPTESACTVFTRSFFGKLYDCLREDGVFLTHAESPDSCEEVFYRVIATLRDVFPIVRPFRVWIPPYIDFWGRVIASKKYDPLELDVSDITERISERGFLLEWLTPELFYAMFRSFSKDVIDKMNQKWRIITETDFPLFNRP